MEPTTAGITVDTNTLSRRATEMAGRAAGQLADTARQTVTAPLEGLRSWGIGGEWLDKIIKTVTDLIASISDWFGSLFSGGTSPAAAPAAPDGSAAAPAAGANPAPATSVEPPAPTPQGAPKPDTRSKGGRQ